MIRGFAAGGGCELAVATDLRIAAEGSRLGIPAARLGISIGHREMRGLVSLVGKGNALYILLSGRLVEADEALRKWAWSTRLPRRKNWKLLPIGWPAEIAALAPLSHAANKKNIKPGAGQARPWTT